jgi:hypothetical protein
MLGKLAKHLRKLGIDTAYCGTISESQIIKQALNEKRTILSRKTKLIKLKEPTQFYFINSNAPLDQLNEVLKHFKISYCELNPFSRCLLCNELLMDIDKNIVEGNVPDYIFNTTARFSKCPNCHRIYWPGTHFKNIFNSLILKQKQCSSDFTETFDNNYREGKNEG